MADSQQRKPWKIGVLIGSIAVVLLIIYALAVPNIAKSWEKSNQFGGMFGGIGALFSGLALAGVVAAIWLQKHGLEDQREDLRSTLDQLTQSTKAHTTSSKALESQIEVMHLAARLNALAVLLSFYERHRGGQFPDYSGTQKPAAELAKTTMQEIDAILKRVRERTK